MCESYDYYDNFEITPKTMFVPEECSDKDDALLPGNIILNPKDIKYHENLQLQRTSAFIARTHKGRIFMSYFSGGAHGDEEAGNFCMIITSDDNGATFQNRAVINPPKETTTRVFDATMWVDEKGRLFIFYNQTYRSFDGRVGVWVLRCDNPDAEELQFTAPKRIANGYFVRKPLVTSKGDWLIATALEDPRWAHGSYKIKHNMLNWLPDEQGVCVYRSVDEGETFERIASRILFPFRHGDEPCMIERSDGSLMMWIRGMNCTGHTFSEDGGHTWTIPVLNPRMNLPNTRFHMGKLKSGNLLLIANYKADMFSYYGGRNHLTAMISKDDGISWEGFLSIDEREGSEQPDFMEGNDGFIYIGYGRAPTLAGETMLAIVTEADILAGKLVNPKSKLRIVAGKSTGIALSERYEQVRKIAEEYNIEI